MNQDKSEQEIARWHKQIEMIGIDIRGLDQEIETGRFKLKTKVMNAHFINELDKIGLQLINIKATLTGRLVVLLEAKDRNPRSAQQPS
jgi:hypothetical protein